MKKQLTLAFVLTCTIAFAQTIPEDTLNTPPDITTSHLSCSDFTTYNDWKSLSSGSQSYLFHCQGHERVLIGLVPNDGAGNLTLDNDLYKELNIFGQGLIQRQGASASFTFLRTDGVGANMIAGQSGCTFQFDRAGTFEIRSNKIAEIKKARSVIASGAKTILIVENDEKIGLFTSNPQQALHLQSSGFTALRLDSRTGFATNGLVQHQWDIGTDTDGKLKFNKEDATKFTITDTGLVGINTTSPSVRLEVNSGAANSIPIVAITTPNGDDFVSIFGGRSANQNPFIAWKRGPLRFATATAFSGGTFTELMRIQPDGRVGIGTQNPLTLLHVCGTIAAEEVIVTTTGCDFVFEPSYNLMNLGDLSLYIEKHKHLPGIEPAKEMEADGIEIGAQYSKLLQKIEELTLYTIEQQKQIEKLKEQNELIKEEINKFK